MAPKRQAEQIHLQLTINAKTYQLFFIYCFSGCKNDTSTSRRLKKKRKKKLQINSEECSESEIQHRVENGQKQSAGLVALCLVFAQQKVPYKCSIQELSEGKKL